jgi:hypothetical protein
MIKTSKNMANFLYFGIGLEKTNKFKPKKTSIFNLYNSYIHNYNKNPPTNGGQLYRSTRFSFLSYGLKYNVLKKHQLNFGLQGGGFILDNLGMVAYAHVYGISINPQIEYKFTFEKVKLGLDVNCYQLMGVFNNYAIDMGLKQGDYSYIIFNKMNFGYGLYASVNFNLTIKL